MTPDTQNLNPAQNELVAVGASVGAGCHPCVSHHLKKGVEAGLDPGQLLAAVTEAEGIASEAAILVGDHARGKIGATASATLTPLDDALAALGASLGANDAAAIDLKLRAALDAGASRPQLEQAIETARTVQENAGRIHVNKAAQLLDSLTATSPGTAEADTGCGCENGNETAPAAESGEGFDFAAMMDHCRQMSSGRSGCSNATAEKPAVSGRAEPQSCAAGRESRR